MTKAKPINTQKSGRGGKRSTSWQAGIKSPNPYGRPKDDESWSGIIRVLQNMNAEEITDMVGGTKTDLGRSFIQMPKNIQMKYLITLRAMAGLMFEPNSSLWEKIMERTDGKVPQAVELGNMGEEGLKVIIEYADSKTAITKTTSNGAEDN